MQCLRDCLGAPCLAHCKRAPRRGALAGDASLSRRRRARAVVAAQQALSDQVLEQCGTRGQFRDLFARLRDYPKFGLPVQHGEPGGVQRRAPSCRIGSGARPLEGPRCVPRLARRGDLEVAPTCASVALPPTHWEGPLQGRAPRPGRAGAGGTTRRTAGSRRRARCTARPRRRWTATRRWCWIRTRWRRMGPCRRPAMRSAGTARLWRTARPGARARSPRVRARRGRPGALAGLSVCVRQRARRLPCSARVPEARGRSSASCVFCAELAAHFCSARVPARDACPFLGF
jgi:hypothetical protein